MMKIMMFVALCCLMAAAQPTIDGLIDPDDEWYLYLLRRYFVVSLCFSSSLVKTEKV